MKLRKWLGLALVLGSLMAGCASTPPAPVAVAEAPAVQALVEVPAPPAEPDRITVERDGFSPLAQAPAHTLGFQLRWGSPAQVERWSVAFTDAAGTPVRILSGTDPVPTLGWDGRDDRGGLVAPGPYRAVLKTAAPGAEPAESARSATFLVDIVPPSGTLTVSPQPWVRNNGELTFQLTVTEGDAPGATWRLAVFHPDGRRFRDFISQEYRQGTVVWDGRAANGGELEPGTVYRVEAEIFDHYGNRGIVTTDLRTAEPAPVLAPLTEVLHFAPYSSDLGAVTGDRKRDNDGALDRLAERLGKPTPGSVRATGHANHVFFDDPVRGPREQRQTLVPLSLARAQAVVEALRARGVEAPMALFGLGGDEPEVPFSDAEGRWQNRRVVVEVSAP